MTAVQVFVLAFLSVKPLDVIIRPLDISSRVSGDRTEELERERERLETSLVVFKVREPGKLKHNLLPNLTK